MWEDGYSMDTNIIRIKNTIKTLNPDVVFVSMRNDNLVDIETMVQVVKSTGTKVGLIADHALDPYNFKHRFIEMYPDYFVYTFRPRKAIKFYNTKIISKVYDNITPDYILEESGPTNPNGFVLTDNFDLITSENFIIKAMDTNYQHNFLTDDFMKKWTSFS